MKKLYNTSVACWLIGLSVTLSITVYAQQTDPYVNSDMPKSSEQKSGNKNKKPFDLMSKLKFGGNFGAFFGTQTYISLSPRVGYKINEKWLAGIGANYIYYSIKEYGQKFSTSIYGPSVFTQYQIFSGLFAYGEYNAYNLTVYRPYATTPPYEYRTWIGSAPVGLGYFSSGQMGGVYLAVLYDLINNPNSPYYRPRYPSCLGWDFFYKNN